MPLEPVPIRQKLLAWYHADHRRLPWRKTRDPYAIWVSEVMLQQTQVATVIPYYHRFLARFPTPADLAAADLQAVLKLWEGLGYYSRARHLHRAAGEVVTRHGGRVPDDPAAFRALPGVGDYIAAAVLSIAFGRVMAVVDGNVKRLLTRLFEIDLPVNRSGAHKDFQSIADRLICHDQPADFNQAMMELGALICRPKKPACGDCPLADGCQANLNRTTDRFPVRERSREIPHRHLAIAVIPRKGKMLVVQRPTEGFLGGMWEFPAVPVVPDEADWPTIEARLQAEIGLGIRLVRRLTRIRHAYTHFILSAEIYLGLPATGRIRLKSAQDYRWVGLRALRRLPLHKANHKFLAVLETVWQALDSADG